MVGDAKAGPHGGDELKERGGAELHGDGPGAGLEFHESYHNQERGADSNRGADEHDVPG